MRGLLSLLCVTLWLTDASGMPLKKLKSQPKLASEEDVNVLTYGVLQFSDAIHHAYQDTTRKMSHVNTLLTRQEGALKHLQDEVTRAAGKEEELRKSLSRLQTQTAALHEQALQMKTVMQTVEEEQAALHSQVTGLETSLDSSTPNIKTLKEQALLHSSVLKALEEWVQGERRTLVDQDQQLARIQSLADS